MNPDLTSQLSKALKGTVLFTVCQDVFLVASSTQQWMCKSSYKKVDEATMELLLCVFGKSNVGKCFIAVMEICSRCRLGLFFTFTAAVN